MKWFDDIEDYDLRQLMRMKHQLESYRGKGLDLGDLIGDLTFLLNALNKIPEEWEIEFYECLTNLESAYASFLYHQLSTLPQEDKSIVDNAVTKLEELIEKHPNFKDTTKVKEEWE